MYTTLTVTASVLICWGTTVAEPLLCLLCERGVLRWVEPWDGTLEANMACTVCGSVYHGMNDYLEMSGFPMREKTNDTDRKT